MMPNYPEREDCTLTEKFFLMYGYLAAVAICLSFVAIDCVAGGVDHEKARQAMETEEILPLGKILDIIRRSHQGDVLSVILIDSEDGLHGWVYDIRLLDQQGQVSALRVDAGTGSLLSQSGWR